VSRLLALLLGLALSACNGPLPFLSGGKLAGTSAPAPADWSSVPDSGTAQLETRPDDPYSVNLVYTVVAGRVYINAGDTETNWVKHIAANPDVRLRIDGTLYVLRAERVGDRAEIAAFGAAWTSQSMFRRDPAKLDPVFVYRLVSR
jgi:hypothetical protein